MNYKLIASLELRALLEASARDDESYKLLMTFVQTGWPDKAEKVPAELKPYANYTDELAISNGFVFKGDRIIIPKAARNDVMTRLHSSHTGIGGLIRRARNTVYYPGITADIKRVA